MVIDEKLQKKHREAAAKLKPRPVELPSGKWRCQVMVEGKRLSVVEATPQLAHARVLAIKAGLVEEEIRSAEQKKRITLRDAIDHYVRLKEGVLSPSTIRGYETIKRNRFQKMMGLDIRGITKEDVQLAVNEEAKKVSAKTVYNSYGLIRPVLKEFGVDIFGIKLPQRIKPKKKYLQPDDIGRLLEASAGDTCEIEILLAVWLGMRRSEIIGLCWDCVDFDAGTITVRRTFVPDKHNQWVLKSGAKNESSQRTISCPAYILEKLKARYRPGAEGQVFKVHPETLRKHLHRICERAGITDTTVHGLRHTNAAMMRSIGVNDEHAMARGGWTNAATYKQTYSYVFEQDATRYDTQIDEYIQNLHTKLHTEKEKSADTNG